MEGEKEKNHCKHCETFVMQNSRPTENLLYLLLAMCKTQATGKLFKAIMVLYFY